MGFHPKLFWLGWLLSALVFALPMSLLTIIVGAFTFWRTVSAAFYVFTVIGFVLAGITFCFMLYSVFNKAIYGEVAQFFACERLNDSMIIGAMFTLVFAIACPLIQIGVLVELPLRTQQGIKFFPPTILN